MIGRIGDREAREGQPQMFRLRFAALNMTSAFGGPLEMQNGSLEIRIFVARRLGGGQPRMFRLRFAALNMTGAFGIVGG